MVFCELNERISRKSKWTHKCGFLLKGFELAGVYLIAVLERIVWSDRSLWEIRTILSKVAVDESSKTRRHICAGTILAVGTRGQMLELK
jgi:hypothetical protein